MAGVGSEGISVEHQGEPEASGARAREAGLAVIEASSGTLYQEEGAVVGSFPMGVCEDMQLARHTMEVPLAIAVTRHGTHPTRARGTILEEALGLRRSKRAAQKTRRTKTLTASGSVFRWRWGS